jgi:hypothetical protein
MTRTQWEGRKNLAGSALPILTFRRFGYTRTVEDLSGQRG